MTNNTPVGPGTRVTLLFSIELESGEQIDSTEQKPAEFSVGDGKLLPGFENAMFGMKSGDKGKLLIPAESAFRPTIPCPDCASVSRDIPK